MLQPLDAKLLLIRCDGCARAARHRNKRRKIKPAPRQRLREGKTRAGRGGIAVDLFAQHAKAILRAHRLIGGAHAGRVHNVEAGAQGVERGPPALPLALHFAEPRQRRCFIIALGRALIGGESGGGGVLHQRPGVTRLVSGGEGRAGPCKPRCRIARRDSDGAREQAHGGARIAALHKARSIVQEIGGRARSESSGVLLQLFFEADGVARQRFIGVILRRLLRARCWCAKQKSRNDRSEHANESHIRLRYLFVGIAACRCAVLHFQRRR